MIRVARNVWRAANVVYSRYRGIPPRYLPVVLLFVTDHCNLRCSMCGVCDKKTDAGGELTTAQWKDVITSATSELGTSVASISGGEPLLRKDIFEIIRFAAEAGLSVHMCSNGALITATIAEELRDSGLATLSLSLDGPDAATHDVLRGAGAFEATIAGIRVLRDVAPELPIGVNTLITKHNLDRLIEMPLLARSLGVRRLKFAPIHTNLLHRHKDPAQFQDLLFSEEDVPAIRSVTKQLQQDCQRNHLSTTSDAFFAGIPELYATPQSFRCYAGYAVCAIGARGEVAPCCDMDSAFSVVSHSLAEIWRDPEFHALRLRSHACASTCWDTTNTELSLRLRPWALGGDLARNWHDLRYYFSGRRR